MSSRGTSSIKITKIHIASIVIISILVICTFGIVTALDYDKNSYDILWTSSLGYYITDISWSPDSKEVAITSSGGSSYGGMNIYDAASGELQPLNLNLSSFHTEFNAVGWSQTDKNILAVSNYQGEVIVINKSTSDHFFAHQTSSIQFPASDVSFAHNSNKIAFTVILNGIADEYANKYYNGTGFAGRVIVIYDIDTKSTVGLINCYALGYSGDYAPYRVSWSPDDKMIAVITNAGAKVLISDINEIIDTISDYNTFNITNHSILELNNTKPITHFKWSPNGDRIATVERRNDSFDTSASLNVWDSSSGELINHITINGTNSIISFDWLSEDQLILQCGQWISGFIGKLIVYDLSNNTVISEINNNDYISSSQGHAGGMDLSPDKKYLIMASGPKIIMLKESGPDTEQVIAFSGMGILTPSLFGLAILRQNKQKHKGKIH